MPWLDGADVERVVFDGPSRVVDIGVTQRFFRGATRRAVQVRDLECVDATCDEPWGRCEVDHVVPASRGGLTTVANGALRCAFHNRAKGATLTDDPRDGDLP